ncbi:Allene oxide synthase [Hibiscus syriacus]|uniref:Allene oxide synthase n=1 Tax=Hibiscus syriacus TaxID=106335 RepID=A0A6A3CKK9_HIBSY|nr:Allene oxide synthase [Hibiscus syriacus]
MAAATSPTSTRSSTHPATVRPVSDLPSEKTGETKLPLKKIPGDYGLPFFGAIKDRLDYFYNQVIALLDAKSFPVLFDVSKVEKKDLFTGTYMPSTKLTGGYRILSYLDPSEPKHAKIKQLLFFLLKSIKDRVFPEFEACYTELFATVEKEVAAKGKSNFSTLNEQAAFNFLGRAYFGSNPPDTKLGTDGPSSIAKWVLFNLAPVLSLGLPKYIEDLLLHTFPLPAFLVKRDYNKLYDFIYQSSGFVQDEAEKLGLSREEACHNLLFATCFNTYGGVKILFPSILKYIGQAGEELHTKLALEIRSAIKSNGGKLSMAALEQMPLNEICVKKGEMLFGFQPIATKDRKVFERAEEFVPDRFVGADGEKLLKYVVWSNGPETETPSVANKQCAGKEFVVLIARLLVVQLFKRYDTFEIDVGTSPLGAAITIKSFKRASS